jgi:acyl-CoA thioester hydrolase
VSEPFKLSIDVGLRWRDIDVFGHVNQSVYHELLEEARAGLMAELYRQGGEGPNRGAFVVRHVELDYHHEVRRDHEHVTITAQLAHVGTSSIRIAQEVRLPDGTLAASGATILVGWDPTTRGKREISADERALLTARAPALTDPSGT